MSPFSFLGNPVASRILGRALERNKVANAYLFSGPAFSPKDEAALEFATGLLCEAGHDKAPCHECRSCKSVESGSHPDLFIVEKDGNSIKIKQSHEILKNAVTRPFYPGRKVFVIKGAEDLTQEASNALLKVVEEPPSYVTFVLTVSHLAGIPETIRSRCQLVPFRAAGSQKRGDTSRGRQVLEEILAGCPAELGYLYSRKPGEERMVLLWDLQAALGDSLREATFDDPGAGYLDALGGLNEALGALVRARRRLLGNTNALLALTVLFQEIQRSVVPVFRKGENQCR